MAIFDTHDTAESAGAGANGGDSAPIATLHGGEKECQQASVDEALTPESRMDEILTLEPLLEAVREGIEGAGWKLSGLQKTTSLEFEGRWEGESTRSAYLFFHAPDRADGVSIDVYLDETSQGLAGNLALVVDVVPLAHLGEPARVLSELGTIAKTELPRGHLAPLTLRLRLPDGSREPGRAEAEVRFKLVLPSRTIAAGRAELRRLVADTVASFERISASEALARYLPSD
jgi:hypothetical protein